MRFFLIFGSKEFVYLPSVFPASGHFFWSAQHFDLQDSLHMHPAEDSSEALPNSRSAATIVARKLPKIAFLRFMSLIPFKKKTRTRAAIARPTDPLCVEVLPRPLTVRRVGS